MKKLLIITAVIMIIMVVMIIIVIIRCHLASFWVDISVTMVVVTAIAVTTAACCHPNHN